MSIKEQLAAQIAAVERELTTLTPELDRLWQRYKQAEEQMKAIGWYPMYVRKGELEERLKVLRQMSEEAGAEQEVKA